MSRKYDVRFCKCGRIHMVLRGDLDNAIERNKNLLLICGGCGHATLIGADVGFDYDNPEITHHVMYSVDFSPEKDMTILSGDFDNHQDSQKGIYKIFYSHGLKVPMMTGQYATDFAFGMFSDRWYPDFYKIQRKDVTVKEVMEFIDKYRHDRTTVNMDRFIDETPDEFLDEISNYIIKGFDWKGTQWENEWNK